MHACMHTQAGDALGAWGGRACIHVVHVHVYAYRQEMLSALGGGDGTDVASVTATDALNAPGMYIHVYSCPHIHVHSCLPPV